MPPTMLMVPVSTFCRSVMLADVSRMSLNTRCASWSSASPAAVIWTRRPRRTKSRSWNSSSSSRICRLMADCETWRRAPAAVNDPVSAIALTISSCRRSIAPRLWGKGSYKGNKKNRFNLSILVMGLPDRQRALHVLALRVQRQIAVEREGAGPVGPEFERHRLPGAGALDDAVVVDGEAVRDVLRREGDLDQVVPVDLNGVGRKSVAIARDAELPDLTLILRGDRDQEHDGGGQGDEHQPLACTHDPTPHSPLDGLAAKMVAARP